MNINRNAFHSIAFLVTVYLVLYNIFEKAKNNFQINNNIQNISEKAYKIWSYIDNFLHNGISGFSFLLFLIFFITSVTFFQEAEQFRTIQLKPYYIKLFGIMFTMYVVSLMFGAGIEKLMNDGNARIFTGLITYYNFHIIKQGFGGAALGHLWMFCIIFHGLFILPLLIKYLPQTNRIIALLVIILFSIVYKIFVLKTGNNAWMNIFLNTIAYIDVMSVGILAANIFANWHSKFNVKNISMFSFSLLIILLITDDFLLWDNIFSASIKRGFYVILFALLVIPYFGKDTFKTMKFSFFKTWISILFFHVPAISMMLYYFRDINNKNPYLFVVSSVLITFLFGITLHFFLYKPLSKIINKIA